MVKGKTSTGYEYEINPERFKDARFLMEFARIRKNGDETGYFLLMDRVLGSEVYEDLCRHCETDEGIAPLDAVLREIKEIFEAVTKNAETKN